MILILIFFIFHHLFTVMLMNFILHLFPKDLSHPSKVISINFNISLIKLIFNLLHMMLIVNHLFFLDKLLLCQSVIIPSFLIFIILFLIFKFGNLILLSIFIILGMMLIMLSFNSFFSYLFFYCGAFSFLSFISYSSFTF